MRKNRASSTIKTIWGNVHGGFTKVPNFLNDEIAGQVFREVEGIARAPRTKNEKRRRISAKVLHHLYSACLMVQNLAGLREAGPERKDDVFVGLKAARLARTLGYSAKTVSAGLDILIDAGLLERSMGDYRVRQLDPGKPEVFVAFLEYLLDHAAFPPPEWWHPSSIPTAEVVQVTARPALPDWLRLSYATERVTDCGYCGLPVEGGRIGQLGGMTSMHYECDEKPLDPSTIPMCKVCGWAVETKDAEAALSGVPYGDGWRHKGCEEAVARDQDTEQTVEPEEWKLKRERVKAEWAQRERDICQAAGLMDFQSSSCLLCGVNFQTDEYMGDLLKLRRQYVSDYPSVCGNCVEDLTPQPTT